MPGGGEGLKVATVELKVPNVEVLGETCLRRSWFSLGIPPCWGAVKGGLEKNKPLFKAALAIEVKLSSRLSVVGEDIGEDLPVLGLEHRGDVSNGSNSPFSPLPRVIIIKLGEGPSPAFGFGPNHAAWPLKSQFRTDLVRFWIIDFGRERVGDALLHFVVGWFL